MKILVVDDERDIRETLEMCWADYEQLEVALAASAEEAMDMLERSVPDVVLTDFRMPGMDGLDLARHVQSHYPTVRVVMMSAFPDPQLERNSVEAGCERLISKPFDPFDILEAILPDTKD